MKDSQTEAIDRIESDNEVVHESDIPFLTWSELPLLLLLSPLFLFLGIHVAGLAMLIRSYLRIPYFATFTMLYVLLLIPAWVWYGSHVWTLLFGSSVVLLASLIPLGHGREEAMNGSNFENAAPAHIVLILVYVFVPAFDAVDKARSRTNEMQNRIENAGPPNAGPNAHGAGTIDRKSPKSATTVGTK